MAHLERRLNSNASQRGPKLLKLGMLFKNQTHPRTHKHTHTPYTGANTDIEGTVMYVHTHVNRDISSD